MHSDNFNISTYFNRINYTGPAAADTATLHALMRHQLFSVPFENLDVQAGKVVSLAPDDIADKVLTQGRGGYCYEVNGLFAMALEALGIPYRFVAARPMFYPARRPKTHMALIAEVESRQWLCDLGFGSYGIRAPMALDTLDAAYLPLAVQEAARVPLDPTFAEQKKIMLRCKGLFYACKEGAEAKRFNRLLIDAGFVKNL